MRLGRAQSFAPKFYSQIPTGDPPITITLTGLRALYSLGTLIYTVLTSGGGGGSGRGGAGLLRRR